MLAIHYVYDYVAFLSECVCECVQGCSQGVAQCAAAPPANFNLIFVQNINQLPCIKTGITLIEIINIW